MSLWSALSRLLSPFLPLLLLLLLVGPAHALPIERVSVAFDGSETDGSSRASTVSADGRYVAFTSDATNVVPGDANGYTEDVFYRHRDTGLTVRASVASGGDQANAQSQLPSLSADGAVMAFESDASNLVGDDYNGAGDIFVRLRDTREVSRASVDSSGLEGYESSLMPCLSPEGRYVAFQSGSSLVPEDTNGKDDIFLRHRLTGTTTRVSVASDGTQADGHSRDPSVSADGRYVAFVSVAGNLVPGDENYFDVFVHDTDTGATTRVSVGLGGTQPNGSSDRPRITPDGRFVAFESTASNLVRGDNNDSVDVFVYDRHTRVMERVSVSSEGTESAWGGLQCSISADGRFVAFESLGWEFVPDDLNRAHDIFVRDRLMGRTIRASVDVAGVEGDGDSSSPHLSGDGSCLVFHSEATNLVPGDTNELADVFLVQLGPDIGPQLPAGWNLVAGAPGSDCAGVSLFGFDGTSYYSILATSLVAGRGYWVRFTVPTYVSLTTVPSPLSVHLLPGWNLIGNATPGGVALPPGKTAFVFDGTRYLSRTTLEAAQGAWLRATVEEDIYLAFAP